LEIPVDLIIRVRGDRPSHLSIISHSPHPKKLFARYALLGCERAGREVPGVSQPVNSPTALGGWAAGRFPWLSQRVTPPPEKHLKRLAPLSLTVRELLIAVAAADGGSGSHVVWGSRAPRAWGERLVSERAVCAFQGAWSLAGAAQHLSFCECSSRGRPSAQ